MWNVKSWGLLIFVLLGSFGCKKAAEQPAENTQLFIASPARPIGQDHRGEIFRITWFKQPSSTDFERLVLHSDGYVEHWSVNIIWNAQLVDLGQLSAGQQEEVRAILKRMVETNLTERVDPATATESLAIIGEETYLAEPIEGLIITLSFLWKAENRALSFSESSCTDELGRLLEIAGTALGGRAGSLDAPQDICRVGDEHREQQAPNLPTVTSIPFANLPGAIKLTHAAPPLFRATWLGQPFDGSFHRLTLYPSGYVTYQQFADGGVYKKVEGTLAEKERQEVQTILALATNMNSIEQSAGTTIVMLGFPWDVVNNLFTARGSNCSNDLQRLFEIMDMLLRQASPDVDFPSPCQER